MFKIHKADDGRVLPFEHLPAAAITPKVGMALTVTGGQLAVCGGGTKPAYICMQEKDTAVEAGTEIPVVRVQADVIWETTNSAAFTSIKAGSKVTLTADGLQVTATTADGVAEVVAFDDTVAGSKVLVRFN